MKSSINVKNLYTGTIHWLLVLQGTEQVCTIMKQVEWYYGIWRRILASLHQKSWLEELILFKCPYSRNGLHSQCNFCQSSSGILNRHRKGKKKILKFIWNHRRLSVTGTIELEEQTGTITLSDFKEYYKTTVIKTELYWPKSKHIDQWNKIQSPEINPHI